MVRALLRCLVVALLVTACNVPGQPVSPGQTTASVAAPAPASPLLPSLSPPSTPALSPSAAPVQALPMRISAQLDPPMPLAGAEFVLRLFVVNDGDRTAHGVFIATSGPWDRWTVLDVAPGMFAREASAWRIVSPVDVPRKDTRTVTMRIRADDPSQEQLTFAVREAEPAELP